MGSLAPWIKTSIIAFGVQDGIEHARLLHRLDECATCGPWRIPMDEVERMWTDLSELSKRIHDRTEGIRYAYAEDAGQILQEIAQGVENGLKSP